MMDERNSEIGPRSDTPPANQESSETKSKKEIATPTRGVNWSQRLMVAFTGVIAVSAFTYTMVAIWQLGIIGEQVDVMSKQSKALESTLIETQEIVKATKNGANAAMRSADAAEKAVEATINSIRLEQRAWVGVKSMTWKGEVKKGEKLEAVILFENTGRTPALDVMIRQGSGTLYPTKKMLGLPTRGEKSMVVIAPNNTFSSLKTIARA